MFVVIYLPDFALQAVLRQEPELRSQPVVLIEEESPKAKISQLTEAARSAGIFTGMTSTQAVARCGHALIRPRSAAAERIAHDALLQCAGTLSPFIEDTSPGVCTTGRACSPSAPFRTAEDSRPYLLCRTQLENLHLHSCIGIAETPDLALLAAHRAEPILVVENSRAFLDPLPVSALTPSPEILSILDKWGVRTLREFTALGKEALVARLGPEAILLFERATGTHTRPLRLVPPPETFEEAMEFEHEIETLEPLLFVLRRLLEQLTLRLNTAYLVASVLTLRLSFSPNPKAESRAPQSYARSFKIPEPTCKLDPLFRMLHTHLENFTADSPIIALELAAEPCRAERRQFGLFETALRDPNRFQETLARLAALVSNDCVGTPQNIDTHRPDTFHLIPFTAESIVPSSSPLDRLGALSPPKRFIPHPSSLRIRRLRPPISTNIRPSNSLSVQGPWISSGDWWDAQSWGREEWDVQLEDGVLCRIYQEKDGWFLEGLYD